MVEMFGVIDEICAAHGLQQVLHSHVQTVVETKDDINRVLDTCDVDFCLDTGHMAIGGQDPVAFAKEAMERVGHVHLKDVRLDMVPPVLRREVTLMAATQAGLFTPLGQGDVDILGVVQTLEARRLPRLVRHRAGHGDHRRSPGRGRGSDHAGAHVHAVPHRRRRSRSRADMQVAPIDVLSVGRVSVDLYAAEQGVGFDGQQTFTKSVGGSPTNVAVAAARLGRRAALATKVGDDGFGEYVRRRLAGWGVMTDYVATRARRADPAGARSARPARDAEGGLLPRSRGAGHDPHRRRHPRRRHPFVRAAVDQPGRARPRLDG